MIPSTSFIVICVQLAPVVYVSLTITAILSLFSPLLRDLAAHGKIRDSVGTATSSRTSSSRNDEETFFLSFVMNPCQVLLKHPSFQINKRRFADFYAIGAVWAIIIIGLDVNVGVGKSHRLRLAEMLLYSHLGRRWYECHFVHIWNGGTMHIAGYALGLLHYILLPFIFISSSTVEKASLYHGHDVFVNVLSAGLNLYAQYQQHVHHCLLADCRKNCSNQEGERGGERKERYSMPKGRWFEYVCCPHYLAEILIYVSFAIMLHDQVLDVKSESLLLQDLAIYYCSRFQSYKHVIMVVWVATNLSISAKSSHEWYCKKFPMFAKKRAALIPSIW